MVDVFQVEVQVMLLQAGWVLAEWLLKYPYSEFEGVSGGAKQRGLWLLEGQGRALALVIGNEPDITVLPFV